MHNWLQNFSGDSSCTYAQCVHLEHKWQVDLCSTQCNGLHTRSQMCNAKFLNFVFRYPAVVNYASYPARGRRNYALSMLCTKRISRYSSRQVMLLCTNLLQCLRINLNMLNVWDRHSFSSDQRNFLLTLQLNFGNCAVRQRTVSKQSETLPK